MLAYQYFLQKICLSVENIQYLVKVCGKLRDNVAFRSENEAFYCF